MSITLYTDTGAVSSYTALGFGKSPANDLSSRLGVPSEQDPIKHHVAAVLDAHHTVELFSKKAGHADNELSIQALMVILGHLL